jgi:hypothetical protein
VNRQKESSMVERRLLALARLTCLVGGLLALSACGSSSHPAGGCDGLEIRQVLEEKPDAQSSIHEYMGTQFNLGPTNCFGVEDTTRVINSGHGYEVAFKISPADADRFRTLTAASVKRRIALMIDGKIVSVVTVMSPLPPGGMLGGPAEGWTEAEAERIRDRLND